LPLVATQVLTLLGKLADHYEQLVPKILALEQRIDTAHRSALTP
jgi:hypothetical protein